MKPIFPLSKTSRRLGFAVATAALAFGVSAPAQAGGGYISAGYHGGYYGGGYYAAGYRYRHRGYHRYHRRHRHGGAGKGAAIALGVIGGAIILNELAEDRARDRYARDRYYQDRYYENRYRARDYDYDRGYRDGQYDARRDSERYEDDAYYRNDDRANDDGVYDDSGLAGGPGEARETPWAGPQPISAGAAFQTCLDHARNALGERGFVISAPYRPETIEDRGEALLMTATVRARRGGESWARAMSCEANETRVYRMELI
ncbi:MAG: hypothetical protein AAFW68_07290 [Pseudomonadota bacterium]